MRGECRHDTDEERVLTGTRVIDEIRLAVEKGYRIREIYEIYEYHVTQYNRETGDGGLRRIHRYVSEIEGRS